MLCIKLSKKSLTEPRCSSGTWSILAKFREWRRISKFWREKSLVEAMWRISGEKEKEIVAKALDGQRYPCPASVGCGSSWGGSRAAAPKGSMIYAFTHMGSFLLLLLLLRTPLPPASRPIPQPGGPYISLQAQIPILRPKSLASGIWALGSQGTNKFFLLLA